MSSERERLEESLQRGEQELAKDGGTPLDELDDDLIDYARSQWDGRKSRTEYDE